MKYEALAKKVRLAIPAFIMPIFPLKQMPKYKHLS